MFHVITFQLMSFHAENICIKMLKINFLEINSIKLFGLSTLKIEV